MGCELLSDFSSFKTVITTGALIVNGVDML